MLYFFNKTRYGTLVRFIVGAAILILGIVADARIAIVLGAVLIAWGLFSVARRRRVDSDDGER